MAHIPFKERLWCSVDEACQVTGQGRTAVFAKISAGDIVSKLEGRRRLIHVPSLIARYENSSSPGLKALEDNNPGADAAIELKFVRESV